MYNNKIGHGKRAYVMAPVVQNFTGCVHEVI